MGNPGNKESSSGIDNDLQKNFDKFKQFWLEANKISRLPRLNDIIIKALSKANIHSAIFKSNGPHNNNTEKLRAYYIKFLDEVGEIMALFLEIKPCIFGNNLANQHQNLLKEFGYEIIGHYIFNRHQIDNIIRKHPEVFAKYINGETILTDRLLVDISSADTCWEMDLERGLILGYPYTEAEKYDKYIKFKKEISERIKAKYGPKSSEHAIFEESLIEKNIGKLIEITEEFNINIDDEIKELIETKDFEYNYGIKWVKFGENSSEAEQQISIINEIYNQLYWSFSDKIEATLLAKLLKDLADVVRKKIKHLVNLI